MKYSNEKRILGARFFLLTAISSFYLLTGCQNAHSQLNHDSIKAKGKLETIYGITLRPNLIKFSVISSGCTKAKDFTLDVISITENEKHVSLRRLKPDHCRAMPKLIQITMTLPQSNNRSAKVFVKNPFSVNDNDKEKPLRFEK